MAKRLSTRGIKKNRQYTYEDVAELLGVKIQTVRAWRDKGLDVLTSTTPHIIMGFALKEFIAKRAKDALQPLKDDEVFCFRCKAPRKPFGRMADYEPINDVRGRLITLCSQCEGRCVRLTSAADMLQLSTKIEIATITGRAA